jgi:parvulin-like peptidyl-prolyl isomerase
VSPGPHMTRRSSLLLLSLAVLGLVAAGCGGGGGGGKKASTTTPKNCSAKLSGGAVAAVCNAAITRAQFDEVVGQAKRNYKLQKRTFPAVGSPDYKTLSGQIVDFLVQRSEFAQKAAGMGVKVTDKDIANRLKQIKKQYFGSNEKRYQTQLKQQGLTDAEVREDIRAQLISDGIYKKVTASNTVTDKAVSDYYKQHLTDQYTQAARTDPASRDVRHILVKTKTLADTIYTQVKSGADFATLAKKYTLDTSTKATGGKLTISKGQTVPQFDKVAFALKKNEISEPVHTRFGWHVIQALSDIAPEKKVAKKVTPFSQVKSAIKAQLLSTEKSQTMQAWIESTKKEFASSIQYANGFTPVSPATTTTVSPTTTG